MDYNTSGYRAAPLGTVLAAIGAEYVNGIAKPLDIISLQEQSTSGSDTASIVSLLNSLYGAGTYASTTLYGFSTGAGTQTIVYNTSAVQLIGQELVGTTSSSGMARQALRAEFRPVGYDSSADFYIYTNHYKAGDTSSDAARRNAEAAIIRANADALGVGQSIIYTGDFNIYRSSESMWTTLTASGNGQAVDPINRVGNWNNNSAFLDVHTQSPTTTQRYSGQTTGGMDDRFDWQMVTSALMDNEGLSVIAGSYHAFGNTGTHLFNDDITSGSVSALQARLPGYTVEQASAVLTALASATDHLPVVADYQIPAKMGVTVGTLPLKVLVGANATVDITVTNTANAVAINGADELDYGMSGSGAVIGTASGTDNALGGGNTHLAALRTTDVGAQSGRINVSSSSQSVANGTFSQAVAYSVLDHARGSFSALSVLESSTLDFGVLDINSAPLTLSAGIFNLLATAGYTAGMDLDSINVTGDEAFFSLALLPFDRLSAGRGQAFDVTFLGGLLGQYEAVYQFHTSDEDLPGAQDLSTLNLTVKATVVPEPSSGALMGAAVALIYLRRRKRAVI